MEAAGELAAMMRESTFLFAPVMTCLAVETPDPEKWNTLGRTCGKAEWSEQIPGKGSSGSFAGRRRPIRKGEVRFYRGEKESRVVKRALSLVRSQLVGADASSSKSYQLRKKWVVIINGGEEYSLAITFAPHTVRSQAKQAARTFYMAGRKESCSWEE